jgi:hypothetical protein
LDRSSRPSATLVPEVAQARAGETRQHGDHQHLQQVALGEGAEEGVGDQVQEIGDQALAVLGLGQVAGGDLGIQRGGIDVEPPPRLHGAPDDQADHQRQGRDHLEIEQRL